MIRYSINDLEKITGIKAHTIRMWEKRYNVVLPERTSTNIRYYQDCDLKKLLNISTLNKHGFKISQIIRMDPEEVNEKVVELSGSANDYESQINSLVVSMIELNENGFNKVLSSSILKMGFEKTVTHILYPFLEKIGLLWQIGTINPAQEHFITNLIRQKLIIAIDGQTDPPKEGGKTFLLFLPENELHEMGLLFYSYLLKKSGHKVIYLGQSVPFDDLVEILQIRETDYLFTYFVAALAPKEIPEYLRKLSKAVKNKKVFVTGLQLKEVKKELPKNIIPVENAEQFKEMLKEIG